jgi:hypothetical protein
MKVKKRRRKITLHVIWRVVLCPLVLLYILSGIISQLSLIGFFFIAGDLEDAKWRLSRFEWYKFN